jgi:hypothetical protein
MLQKSTAQIIPFNDQANYIQSEFTILFAVYFEMLSFPYCITLNADL